VGIVIKQHFGDALLQGELALCLFYALPGVRSSLLPLLAWQSRLHDYTHLHGACVTGERGTVSRFSSVDALLTQNIEQPRLLFESKAGTAAIGGQDLGDASLAHYMVLLAFR
jgi:hypothetical protein